jgi:hypothetical protein
LHVNDCESGASRVEFFEPMIAATPGENSIYDFGTNVYFMHRILDSK